MMGDLIGLLGRTAGKRRLQMPGHSRGIFPVLRLTANRGPLALPLP